MEELGDERLGLGGEPSDAIVRTRQSLHDLGSLRAGVRALVREELDELVELVHRHVERRGEDARRSHGGMVERAETWISRRASRAARCGGGGGIFVGGGVPTGNVAEQLFRLDFRMAASCHAPLGDIRSELTPLGASCARLDPRWRTRASLLCLSPTRLLASGASARASRAPLLARASREC